MNKENAGGNHSASSSSGSSSDHIILEKDALRAKRPEDEVERALSSSSHAGANNSSSGSGSQAKNTLMEQPGYDPNRIPSSVFGSKPAGGTMEWSVASNESLFSIQMGNTSFSRDHVSMLYKSGELMKLDELILAQNNNNLPPLAEAENTGKSVSNTNSGDDFSILNGKSALNREPSSRLPPVTEVEHTGRINIMAGVTEEPGAKKVIEKPGNAIPDKLPSNSEDNRTSTSLSLQSDGSTNSTRSFAFPVFPGEVSSLKDVEKESLPPQMPPTQKIEQQPPTPPLQATQTTEQATEPIPPSAPAPAAGFLSYFSCCFSALPCLKSS
ncbi:hypothetical protein ACFE04_009435 [Oxalis oulophora]